MVDKSEPKNNTDGLEMTILSDETGLNGDWRLLGQSDDRLQLPTDIELNIDDELEVASNGPPMSNDGPVVVTWESLVSSQVNVQLLTAAKDNTSQSPESNIDGRSDNPEQAPETEDLGVHENMPYDTKIFAADSRQTEETLKKRSYILRPTSSREDIYAEISKVATFHQGMEDGQLSKRRSSQPPQRFTRTPIKPFLCSKCGKTFATNGNLKQHWRIHTGEKPYQCHICGTAFNQSCHLNNHRLRHLGIKPYRCLQCGKSFRQMSHLWVHHMTHAEKCDHSNTIPPETSKQSIQTTLEEKPFRCSICGKGFVDIGYLRQHEALHVVEKPYQCLMCEEKFISHVILERHQKIHVDIEKADKPSSLEDSSPRVDGNNDRYLCRQCGQRFPRFFLLKKHEQIHSKNGTGGKCLLRGLPKQEEVIRH